MVFDREAALVALAAGLLTAGAFGTVAALARFLGTANSAFSLSSLDNSSLVRFLARVELVSLVSVALIVGLVGARLGAALGASLGVTALDVVVVVVAGAARVFRAVFAGAAAFLVGTVFVEVEEAGSAALRSSVRGSWRLVGGMRLTRRSRRDWRLAHCASHCACSFSLRASTVKASVSGDS